ncbi:MAG: helix-turn-helix transcriptional regulator [Sphingobium sp.]|nr:helix-turn-helix transcriptional regulator [Sphingobium sp.]
MTLEKITNESKAPEKRRYHDACGMAFGLEMLGERWALFVVRELMLGPRRFSDLRADLPGISANVLTQRLAELEERGIVVRSTLPPPANVQVYGLTDWGYLAEPIVQEVGRWAARSPLHDPTLPISPVSIMLSMRTMILRDRIGTHDFVIGFRFGDLAFRAHIANREIVVTREDPKDARLVVSGTAPGVAAWVHGKVPLSELGPLGVLTGQGDMELAAFFPTLFELPPKVAPPPGQISPPAKSRI